jgi:hypothetical protein
MNTVPDLSDNLRPIFDYEIGRGNSVKRIDRPAGTNCPLAVIFARPLDIDGFTRAHGLPQSVSTWSNRDKHYPIEDGYVCEKTRHVLAGPAAG